MENKKELLKYMIFAGVMGIVVGGIDTVFGKGLILIGEIRNKYFWYLIPFLPIAGIVITWLYYHFNELSLKGMTLVFETGSTKKKKDSFSTYSFSYDWNMVNSFIWRKCR